MESNNISSIDADWKREHCDFFEWQPSKKLLATLRAYQRFQDSWLAELPVIGKLWLFRILLRYRFWSAVTGADIPINSQIGGGLLIPHPTGIVVHPDAKLGPNCLLMSQVVIGTRESGGLPIIGGHVDIGAGAKILGGVTIGDHAKIGANAVVTINVPEGKTAVGIPAKIL